MAGPFDYTIDIKSPFENIAQGYRLGAGMLQARQAQEDRAIAMQQRQAEMERQKIINERISGIINTPNPTARDFTNLAMLLPAEQAKSVRENWQTLNEDNQKQSIAFGTQVLSAFNSDAPQVGIDMLRTRAEAMRNSGDEAQAKAYESWASIAEQNPKAASLTIGTMLASVPGGDKALEMVFKGQKQPAEVREGEAKATTAEVAAKYADTKALLEMEKSGWDIKKLKQDVEFRPLELNLRRLEAQTARENAGLTRQSLQLKVDDARRQYEQAIADRRASAQSAQIGIVDMRQSVSDLRNHSGFSSLFGASLTPGARFIPGSDTSGAESVLESLKARAFMVGVDKMRGLGALGEKEGAKIEAAIAALRPGMPEKDALKALDAIETSMQRLDKLNQQKYGAPPADSFAGNAEPMVDTAEEYNALPSGSIYIDKLDGKKYRKP